MPMLSIKDKLGSQNTKLAEQKAPTLNHPIALENNTEGSFFNIELSAIAVDPNQPRKYFNPASLAELSESIKQKGVLQPVLIRKDMDGQIRLVVGERRYRAARMAGLERIPAILTKGISSILLTTQSKNSLKPNSWTGNIPISASPWPVGLCSKMTEDVEMIGPICR